MEIVPLEFDIITEESMNGAVIRKHNDLIEAKYQLPNLQEQRVISMLLAQIKPDDEDFKCYRISVTDFAKIAGIRVDGVYDELDKTTFSLLARRVSIRNGKDFLHMSWISSAEYKHGFGYVELAFDPKLKPYLLQLKTHFTQHKLESVLYMRSIYSIRLYELLKKESFKKDKNGTFNVFFEYERLREDFGIEKKEYALFANFKRKAIEPAVSEISDKTDLNILDVKYGKTGRKVTNITFMVAVRSENETTLRRDNLRIEDIKPEKESENHPIIDSLISLGFSLETAKTYKNKHGVKKIERNIAYTLAKKQASKVDDIPAFLSKALAEDWGSGWEAEHKKSEEKKEKIAQKKQVEEEKVEELKRMKAKENERIFTIFQETPENEKPFIIQAFLSSMNSITRPLMEKSYNEHGTDVFQKYKPFKSLFIAFLRELENDYSKVFDNVQDLLNDLKN